MQIQTHRIKTIAKKHLIIVALGAILGWLICGFIAGVETNSSASNTIANTLLSSVCGVLMSYIVYFLSLRLDQIFPWTTQLTNRFLSGIIVHFIAVFISTLLLVYSYNVSLLNQVDFMELHKNDFIKFAIILLIIMLIYTVIYFALYSYYSFASLQIETIKYERKQIDLQLNALKSQLSPHFLFNSLNTISSLIYKDVKSAESFIRGLAKMYVYTLSSYHNKLIALNEELDFLSSYLTLIKTRFEDKFICNVDIPLEIKATQIPPLTLQMLVENAVKHNQMDLKNPLQVDITYDGHYILIKNNITAPSHKVNSFNIGLKNIKERYKLLSNTSIAIIQNEQFIVKIPVIR